MTRRAATHATWLSEMTQFVGGEMSSVSADMGSLSSGGSSGWICSEGGRQRPCWGRRFGTPEYGGEEGLLKAQRGGDPRRRVERRGPRGPRGPRPAHWSIGESRSRESCLSTGSPGLLRGVQEDGEPRSPLGRANSHPLRRAHPQFPPPICVLTCRPTSPAHPCTPLP